MAKVIGGSKIEMIDIISLLVNCSIAIAFLSVLLVKSFYFSFRSYYSTKYSNGSKKASFTKLSFATVFLSFIALASITLIVIFSGSMTFLAKTVETEVRDPFEVQWDMGVTIFSISMMLLCVFLFAYVGYYGFTQGDWSKLGTDLKRIYDGIRDRIR